MKDHLWKVSNGPGMEVEYTASSQSPLTRTQPTYSQGGWDTQSKSCVCPRKKGDSFKEWLASQSLGEGRKQTNYYPKHDVLKDSCNNICKSISSRSDKFLCIREILLNLGTGLRKGWVPEGVTFKANTKNG